ncbi:hypothetical protein LguiB_024391 [Lonicera macranthoides]
MAEFEARGIWIQIQNFQHRHPKYRKLFFGKEMIEILESVRIIEIHGKRDIWGNLRPGKLNSNSENSKYRETDDREKEKGFRFLEISGKY